MRAAWNRFRSHGIRRTGSGTDRIKAGPYVGKSIMHLFPVRARVKQIARRRRVTN